MNYSIVIPLFLLFCQRVLRIIPVVFSPPQNANNVIFNANNNNNNINNNINNNNINGKEILKKAKMQIIIHCLNQAIILLNTFINNRIVQIMLYMDKIYSDILYDNGTANAYLLGMVYYQTYYNLLFSIRMIQGSLSSHLSEINLERCKNVWIFHDSYLGVQTPECAFTEQQVEQRSPLFLIFALLNGMLIFMGLHIATKIGCTMKSEWRYFLVVRVLESVKYFTITFFKVYLMNNSPMSYIITQVVKIFLIKSLPLHYVPIQQNDFIMSSLFQVNLYPATLSYAVQGMRVIQEQNMQDTWLFLFIEQIDNLSSLFFYVFIIFSTRQLSLLNYEYIFIGLSVMAQIINMTTMFHTWYLFQTYGPVLNLNITKATPTTKEVERLLRNSPRVITQQIKMKIIELPNKKSLQGSVFLQDLHIFKLLFEYSRYYDLSLSYTDQNDNTIIFEIFTNMKKFHISMSNYQLFEDNYEYFEKIYWFASQHNHILEFNRYNHQIIKKQDEFRIFKFKLYVIKLTFLKHDISISIRKNVFNRQEFLTGILIERYVSTCHQVLAYLRNVESEMHFNPKQILYDLYDYSS